MLSYKYLYHYLARYASLYAREKGTKSCIVTIYQFDCCPIGFHTSL